MASLPDVPPEVSQKIIAQLVQPDRAEIELVSGLYNAKYYRYTNSEKILRSVSQSFDTQAQSDAHSEGNVFVLIRSKRRFFPSNCPVPCITIDQQQYVLEKTHHPGRTICEILLRVEGEGAGPHSQHAVLSPRMLREWLNSLAAQQYASAGPAFKIAVKWCTDHYRKREQVRMAMERLVHRGNTMLFLRAEKDLRTHEKIIAELCATNDGAAQSHLVAQLSKSRAENKRQENVSMERDKLTMSKIGSIDKSDVAQAVFVLDEMTDYCKKLVNAHLDHGIGFLRTYPLNSIRKLDDFRKQCKLFHAAVSDANISPATKEQVAVLYLAASWNFCQVVETDESDYYEHENLEGLCSSRRCWCICAKQLGVPDDATLYKKGVLPPGIRINQDDWYVLQKTHLLNDWLEPGIDPLHVQGRISGLCESLQVLQAEVEDLGKDSPAAESIASEISNSCDVLRSALEEMRFSAQNSGDAEQTLPRCEGVICEGDEDPERDLVCILRDRMLDAKRIRLCVPQPKGLDFQDVPTSSDVMLAESCFLGEWSTPCE